MPNLPIELMSISFGLSAILCVLIFVWFERASTASRKRTDTSAVQASHSKPTARIGGLAIVLALGTVVGLYQNAMSWHISTIAFVSALPVFGVGLAEDLGYLASPRKRLLAAAVSGAVFISLMGQWVPHTGIPGLDIALQWSPFAMMFSLFLAVGISHAFNLIDGLNGLSGSTALAAALALAAIAHQAGLAEHHDLLLMLAAAILGFLVFNFPFGKIFLGDAGAYVVGHFLVWISVSILWNASNVTPLAMLLIFFWPVADTLLAISRRLSLGKPIAQPDRLHFHQLVMRGVEIILLGRRKRRIANPLASLLTMPFIFAPMVAGVLLSDDHSNAAIACVAFAVIFTTTYKTGIWIAPKLRRSACPKPADTSNTEQRLKDHRALMLLRDPIK
ncbi:glycosyltransferase [Lentibacter algarum]|uniref:MraY family glycosyltransferase n=1 Tax=Lentibacter algarum TaxID=576131 RepID=UPI0026EF20F9|nr:glycosyltransferase [Lentibacter algarum]